MRAILAREPGGPEVLELRECADPVPGPGEVVLAVAAAGVNRADLLQRRGLYPPPPGASDIPGLECSGTVAALGPGVTSHRVGDRVTALLSAGGYAELVAVPAGQLMSVPDGIDLVSAAGLPEAACTVWSNLAAASLAEGEWLLVHGGASGIGTMAIQIGRALGARVAVTAGSQHKLEACAALGAELLINYREQDFVEEIRAATGGRGAEVILDNMGAAYLQRNIESLAHGGRLVVIGLQGGLKTEIDLGALLRKNGTVLATSLRGRPESEKSAICRQVETRIWPLIHAGLIKPVIDQVVPLADAPRAHRLLEEGSVVGKVVLSVE